MAEFEDFLARVGAVAAPSKSDIKDVVL